MLLWCTHAVRTRYGENAENAEGPSHPRKSNGPEMLGIVQKVFSVKASAIARMRQKCVRTASKMRQNGSCFIGKRGTFQNASEMRQKCAEHLWGEHLLDDTEMPPRSENVENANTRL